MSQGRVCDRCGEVLKVNRNGDDMDGESAAWLVLRVASVGDLDFCTRTCVIEFLEDPDFVRAYEEDVAAIVDLARTIRGDDEETDDE